MSTFPFADWAAGLVAELAAALGAVSDGPVTAGPGAPIGGPGWAVTLTASGAQRGTITAWVDTNGSDVLARLVMGGDDAPDARAVADMLREMWQQAASAISLKEPFTGIKLAVEGPTLAESGACAAAFDVSLGEHGTAHVCVTGAFEVEKPAPTLPAARNLDVVLDIELPIVVRFGRTILSLKALSGLGPGSIVDMGRTPDEPVELLVSDRVIARGEVVIVAGNYGVRITDLVSPADRVRALEA
jgi:flagellar motor switch protein FliN